MLEIRGPMIAVTNQSNNEIIWLNVDTIEWIKNRSDRSERAALGFSAGEDPMVIVESVPAVLEAIEEVHRRRGIMPRFCPRCGHMEPMEVEGAPSC